VSARGCVGRLINVTTEVEVQADVDPVQLRWAGLPRSRAFDSVDLRREQREYLNVLYLRDGDAWRLVTFEDPDFDQGSRPTCRWRCGTPCRSRSSPTTPPP
jgi:hypothetical protein